MHVGVVGGGVGGVGVCVCVVWGLRVVRVGELVGFPARSCGVGGMSVGSG